MADFHISSGWIEESSGRDRGRREFWYTYIPSRVICYLPKKAIAICIILDGLVSLQT